MRWITLITLVCFLFVALPCFTACQIETGISEEQRQHYLESAADYDKKALEAQKLADACWENYAGVMIVPERERLKNLGERYDKLAEEYRQQANHYRMLAHGCQERKE